MNTSQPSARPPVSGRASSSTPPQAPRATGTPAARRGMPRVILCGLVAAVLTLGLAGTGAAGAAAAGASTESSAAAAATKAGCTRTVTGTHHGALVAGSGVLCLDHATQSGPVRVRPGAGLNVTASVISGALTATRARFVRVCGSTVIGPLRAGATVGPVTAGLAGESCRGDTGHGRLVITGSAGPVRVAGLRQQGPVTLSGNAGGVLLSGASVGGTVTVSGNRGHGQLVISANAISGSLACMANQPAPGDRHQPNTVSGTASGQCAALVPPRKLRDSGSLAQDLSSTLPNLNYGQAVGDFTGAGHDQLAYDQDGQLKIADVNKFGGQVVKSTPTDLLATPNDGLAICPGSSCGPFPVWANSYEHNGATYGMTSVKVAANASNIYMAGATFHSNDANTYQLHLYKLPHDGSCARASCAEKTVSLPNTFNGGGRMNLIVVTSLATGVVGGRALIAVGLSDEGIYIFDGNLNLVTTIGDMTYDGPGTQTPVTALAFGPPTGPGQDGWLAAGVESPGNSMFVWKLNSDGTEQSESTRAGSDWLPWVEMAATFVQINGQTLVAFTRSDGDVLLFTKGTNNGIALADLPVLQRTGQPTGLSAVTPWNGDPNNQELVVGKLDGTTDQVLQWADGALTAVPIGSGGATTGTAGQLYDWWPGYGLGVLHVANTSAGPVTIAMASRSDRGYGCWLDIKLDQPPVPAFPDSDTSVDAGTTSAGYLIAALTPGAGSDTSCATAPPDSTGEQAAYVVITPAGDGADAHIVKLVAGAGELRVASQAGGYLTATVRQLPQPGGSWGTWQLTVTGGSNPAALTAPAVTGHRLAAAPDPANYQPPVSPAADDPCRPVYRFDVTGAQWKNVAAAGQQTAQIPPMTAQGSSDGGQTWTDLGQLMPATAPALADGTVTLGPASFFFQNKPGTATAPGVWTAAQSSQCPATGNQPVTEVRVVSGGLPSSPVMLADPKAPPLDSTLATQVQGARVTPDAPGGIAMPRADGVDQAGLTLQLTPSGGGSVDPSDPRYSLVYYRDDVTKALVTGLYQPGGYAGYTAVGRYAADGTAGQPTRNWLVTTSTAAQHLDPVMNDSGTVYATTTNDASSFAVAASNNPLTPAAGTAANGIGITGCTASPTGTCTLAAPAADGTGPALYQAGPDHNGDPVTGLQLAATAVTGRASLPLQTDPAHAHSLGSAPLRFAVADSQAKLTDTTPFFPSDTIDTALVTAGQLVPVLSVKVGP